VVVVATMRASEYAARNVDAGQEDPPAERELRQVERAVLAVASRVEFARRFSPAELRRAAERAHDPRIADALAHAGQYGLAEYVAAGPVLWRRWRDGLAVDNPAERLAGAAITAVAVDCRRAGLTGALPEALLAELFLDYLEVPVARRVGSEAFEAGLGWAARPVQATSALLLPIEGGWVAFDYLVDQHQADTAAPPVPDGTWAAAVRLAAPDDALAVATAAYLAGQHEIAEQATRKAADAGDHDAEYNLGVLLQEQGQGEEAEQWYRKAAGAGHHPAENNLAVLLQEQGQGEEAEQWWRRAAGAGHYAAGHYAAENNLGALLKERGELEEAEQWWRRAAGAGDHDAEVNLGVLLQEQGRAEEAERWWRKAADAGHRDAEYNLRVLLQEQGRAEEAEEG
jgi:tetratricopeptide (TPR) repeat protein